MVSTRVHVHVLPMFALWEWINFAARVLSTKVITFQQTDPSCSNVE